MRPPFLEEGRQKPLERQELNGRNKCVENSLFPDVPNRFIGVLFLFVRGNRTPFFVVVAGGAFLFIRIDENTV